jgi:phospholipid transport system substrate-binding protein
MIRLAGRVLMLCVIAAAVLPILSAAAVVPAVAISPSLRTKADAGAAMDQPLREFYTALEEAMRSGRATPFLQRFKLLAPAVDAVFDLETVLRVSVGLRWNTMDPDSRIRLFQIFRRFTIATYVENFDRYDGERFQILPGLRDSGPYRIVRTEIITAGGQHVRLDYVMRDANGVWRAVDVLLEGSISRVAVQRSDFRKILANGDADGLIANLRRKIADLSDGALSS